MAGSSTGSEVASAVGVGGIDGVAVVGGVLPVACWAHILSAVASSMQVALTRRYFITL